MLSEFTRRLFKALMDVALATAAYPLAYLFRYNIKPEPELFPQMWITLPIVAASRFVFLYRFGTFRSFLAYAGINDIKNIISAVTLSSLLNIVAIAFTFHFQGFSRAVFLLDWMFAIVLLSGVRLAYRLYRDVAAPEIPANGATPKRAVIVGATDLAEHFIRYSRTHPGGEHIIAIADTPERKGLEISGVPVSCTIDELPRFVIRHNVELVIFAYPSGQEEQVSKIVRQLAHHGVAFKTVPDPSNTRGGPAVIRDLDVADLYRREPISIDTARLKHSLKNACVLVTGAAGSIGAELSKQLAALNPERIILLDRSESGLFHLLEEFKRTCSNGRLEPVLADICNSERIHRILQKYFPEFIFHAAAYKHVPLMEVSPSEALLVNVIGTFRLLEEAKRSGVKKFLYISTDKAIQPVSVMGATKYLAERVVEAFAQEDFHTVIVRFGNVMDSIGSVIPIFREQIRRGGPIEVTHPEAKRYFMSVEEAVMLVLQAFIMGGKGEVFVLDMGEPVNITELAERMISLAGLTPHRDVEIKFTGLRPGERVEEELFDKAEKPILTSHPRILHAFRKSPVNKELLKEVKKIASQAPFPDDQEALQFLQDYVPSFQGKKNNFSK